MSSITTGAGPSTEQSNNDPTALPIVVSYDPTKPEPTEYEKARAEIRAGGMNPNECERLARLSEEEFEAHVEQVITVQRVGTYDPTNRLHGAFAVAFDFFNEHLFENRLPRCVITMRANRSRYGYFARQRFKERDADLTDEIALNPKTFESRTAEAVLSTLVHEMVHAEQFHCCKPGRRGYHNREWGTLMKRVGLHPSNTGLPGGKETGQQMTHYIIEGAPFSVACAQLLASGFKIEYADVERSSGNKKKSEKNKSKYVCGVCGFNAWAKPKAENLCCLDCSRRMEEVA
jgi:predicted SprT family Zn-dependent metalloprotease